MYSTCQRTDEVGATLGSVVRRPRSSGTFCHHPRVPCYDAWREAPGRVTVALQELEGLELIRSRRRQVDILDRLGLIPLAHGDYGMPEAEYERLIGNMGPATSPGPLELTAIDELAPEHR